MLGGEKGPSFRGNWRREHHIVCSGEHFIKLLGPIHRVNSGTSLLWMLADRQYTHTKRGSPGRELAADAAQTNDSQRAVLDFPSGRRITPHQALSPDVL